MGAAGYVAPRHMSAIKAIGGDLRVALDPNDSVGTLDRHFPDAEFFVEFERFDRHIDKLRRQGAGLDYISICSPNYLHDAHCRFALNADANAICEKPVVLNPWNLNALLDLEARTKRKIHPILQLRLHPAIQSLKAKVDLLENNQLSIHLTYITPRGSWYHVSWKGQTEKSGGVATNIGIHFFDMLTYVFGPATTNVVHLRSHDRAAGFLECGRASISWFLSLNRSDLPEGADTKSAYRSLTIDGEELEFSEGFADLHTLSYEQIVEGEGFELLSAMPAIEIASEFRNSPIKVNGGERHPMVAPFVNQ
jgi:UDP-N-acetyl-2-amino-2-deoxyglucuronate dehydrogenase